MTRSAARFLLFVLVCVHGAVAQTDGVYHLTLRNGLPVKRRGAAGAVPADLELDIVFSGGKWQPEAWGFWRDIPGLEHPGRVVASQQRAGKSSASVRLDLICNKREPVFLGGQAEYALEIVTAGGKVEGAFRGTCRPIAERKRQEEIEEAWGWGYNPNEPNPANRMTIPDRWERQLDAGAVTGVVVGVVRPLPVPVPGFKPPEPGEHPRLFFRRDDVPALRAFAKTADGRKLIEKMERLHNLNLRFGVDPNQYMWGPVRGAACGFLYQLTGDRKYAERAHGYCGSGFYTQHMTLMYHFHAYTLMGIALTYDMCQEAWDPERRLMYYGYLEQHLRQHAQRHDQRDLTGTGDRYMFKTDRGGYAYAPLHGVSRDDRFGAGLAGLAILGDRPELYTPPRADEVAEVTPAEGYEPPAGVPVLPFESDVMPRTWLINGPFLRETADDYLGLMGGASKIRPEPGGAVDVEGVQVDWRLYRPAGSSGSRPSIYMRDCGRYISSSTGGGYWPGIELTARWTERFKAKYYAIDVFLYTVIRNEADRVVQALPNWRSVSTGNRMWINGREVKDGELVRMKPGLYPLLVDVKVMGGYSAQMPKLREYTARDYREAMTAKDSAHDVLAGNTVDSNRVLLNVLSIARSMERYIRERYDRKGFAEEFSNETVFPFLMACRNVLGVNPAEHTGASEFIPFAARCRGHLPYWFDLDQMVVQSYASAPKKYRPLANWYIRQYGLGERYGLDGIMRHFAVRGDISPAAPESLGMRLAECFEDYGIFTFRSAWNEPSFMAFLQTGKEPFASRFSAGGFVLHGFGRFWGEWRAPRSPEDRHFSGLVSDLLYPDNGGRVTHADLKPDGSGVVSMVLDRFREGRLLRTEQGRPYVEMGRVLGKNVQWLRSFCADYSGKCGAPVLVAVADRVAIDKRREKAWRMDVGLAGTRKGHGSKPNTRLELGANKFTLSPLDSKATLSAVFVMPGKVEFRLSQYGDFGEMTLLDACVHRKLTDKEAAAKLSSSLSLDPEEVDVGLGGEEDKLKTKAVEMEGKAPPATTFLVVMTLQTGEAPAVEISGTGAGKVARIGRRTVRFDGQKIVLGE